VILTRRGAVRWRSGRPADVARSGRDLDAHREVAAARAAQDELEVPCEARAQGKRQYGPRRKASVHVSFTKAYTR
jgi:hypothetical protein